MKNSATASSNAQAISKATSANKLLGRVKKRSSVLNELISTYDSLSSAYMELAVKTVPKGKKGKVIISSKMKILSRPFTNIPMPSVELPVSLSCDYSSAVLIRKFDVEYSLCGGVNLPKLIVCKGSDGKSYRQLVKVFLDQILISSQTMICDRMPCCPRYLVFVTFFWRRILILVGLKLRSVLIKLFRCLLKLDCWSGSRILYQSVISLVCTFFNLFQPKLILDITQLN
jgi:hypothetical protein